MSLPEDFDTHLARNVQSIKSEFFDPFDVFAPNELIFEKVEVCFENVWTEIIIMCAACVFKLVIFFYFSCIFSWRPISTCTPKLIRYKYPVNGHAINKIIPN